MAAGFASSLATVRPAGSFSCAAAGKANAAKAIVKRIRRNISVTGRQERVGSGWAVGDDNGRKFGGNVSESVADQMGRSKGRAATLRPTQNRGTAACGDGAFAWPRLRSGHITG